MDPKLAKGDPGICTCRVKSCELFGFFYFSFFLKTRLKARVLIRHPFQKEKPAMGCLSRESKLQGPYGLLVPCLRESRPQTSERFTVHKA